MVAWLLGDTDTRMPILYVYLTQLQGPHFWSKDNRVMSPWNTIKDASFVAFEAPGGLSSAPALCESTTCQGRPAYPSFKKDRLEATMISPFLKFVLSSNSRKKKKNILNTKNHTHRITRWWYPPPTLTSIFWLLEEIRFGELTPRGPRVPESAFVLGGIDKCDAQASLGSANEWVPRYAKIIVDFHRVRFPLQVVTSQKNPFLEDNFCLIEGGDFERSGVNLHKTSMAFPI